MSPFALIAGVAIVLVVLDRKRGAVSEPSEPMTARTGIVELETVRGHYLRVDAARAFDMAVRATDVPRVTSSMRTRQQQERLYALWLAGKGNLAAKPGTSKHEIGLAIDARGTPDWEEAMSAAGFVRTVNSEPWHWEFKT